MRTIRQYVLDTYPTVAASKRLTALLVKIQEFNPNLPEDVERPALKPIDWLDLRYQHGRSRSMAKALQAAGQQVKSEWKED